MTKTTVHLDNDLNDNCTTNSPMLVRIYPNGCDQNLHKSDLGGQHMALGIKSNMSKDTPIAACVTVLVHDSCGRILPDSVNHRLHTFTKGTEVLYDLGVSRSKLFTEAKRLLNQNNLYISVTIKEMMKMEHIPKNPLSSMLINILHSQEDNDVTFHFPDNNRIGGHKLILKQTAPTLLNFYKNNKDDTPTIIMDTSIPIFKALLHYAYGGDIAHFIDDNIHDTRYLQNLISAVNKYEMVPLKMMLESHIIHRNIIGTNNAIDWANYAEATDCALLREVTSNFIKVTSESDTLPRGSFTAKLRRIYGSDSSNLSTDILSEISKPQFMNHPVDNMSVSYLREVLEKRGLDADGPKENLQKRLKKDMIHSS